MSPELQVNSIGVMFQILIKNQDGEIVDLSSMLDIEISITRPDGTKIQSSGSLLTDGTDGIVTYTTVSGDLSQAGNYKIQAKVIGSGIEIPSSINSFRCKCNL